MECKGRALRNRDESEIGREGKVGEGMEERETLRNLDWCHMALGDLRVRDKVGGEWNVEERDRKRDRDENAVTARSEAA